MLLLEKADLGLPKPVLGLLAVAATIVLTALSYHFLEKPVPASAQRRPASVEDGPGRAALERQAA